MRFKKIFAVAALVGISFSMSGCDVPREACFLSTLTNNFRSVCAD